MDPSTPIVIDGKSWTLGLPMLPKSAVHNAESCGQWAVIKVLPKTPNARSELSIARHLRGLDTVIPTLGTCETPDTLALLMPRADQSLRDYLMRRRQLREPEALQILINLAQALVDLGKAGVVHRDLKPENVLLYKGSWRLGDFGISCYVNNAIPPNVRQDSTTQHYAAPEQWRHEPAVAALDIYALGIIGHELLTGRRPFPDRDFRDQHLHEDPPTITGVAPLLAALIHECLLKTPTRRPSAQAVLGRLQQLAAAPPTSAGVAALQAANLAATSQLAQKVRQQSQARTEAERREGLLRTAYQQFTQISAELRQTIETNALPVGRPQPKPDNREEDAWLPALAPTNKPVWQFTLGEAAIRLSGVFAPPDGESANRLRLSLPFDVIACAHIAVAGSGNRQGYAGRAHSLWFCDAQKPGVYGWYETAFTDNPIDMSQGNQRNYFDAFAAPGIYVPYALSAWQGQASMALSPSERRYLVAWPFTLLEAGELDDFIDRWTSWLAACSQGLLQIPWEITTIDRSDSWRNENQYSTAPRRKKSRAQVAQTRRWISLVVCVIVVVGSCLLGQMWAAQGDEYARYGASSDPNGGYKTWGAIGMYAVAGLTLLILVGVVREMIKGRGKSKARR